MRNGLTLIEVLIAMTMASIIIIGISVAMATGAKVLKVSNELSTNISAASSYMERYQGDDTYTEGISKKYVIINVNGKNIAMEEIEAKKNEVTVKYYQ
ncbi:MAG: type II secretion system protein J [Lachnospirales bacterium]